MTPIDPLDFTEHPQTEVETKVAKLTDETKQRLETAFVDASIAQDVVHQVLTIVGPIVSQILTKALAGV